MSELGDILGGVLTSDRLGGGGLGGSQSGGRCDGSCDSADCLTLSRGNMTNVRFTFVLHHGALAGGGRFVGSHTGSSDSNSI